MNNLFASYTLQPLTDAYVAEIRGWEYEEPYAAYSFTGHTDEYLSDQTTWGTEQFCLTDGHIVIGQVACQFENLDLWVGWSMNPELCGKGHGADFVKVCLNEIMVKKNPVGRILLRVAAWNQRAIKAYQKAGFVYLNTIQDEIAYSNNMEDFWVMELRTELKL